MNSLQPTCYSAPFKSRHAFNSNTFRTFVVHKYLKKTSRQIRVLNVAWGGQIDDNGVKNCKDHGSWTHMDSSDVRFSGWYLPTTDQFNLCQNTRSIIATGVFLLAGITFTSLCLSKHMFPKCAEISQQICALSMKEAGFSAFEPHDFEGLNTNVNENPKVKSNIDKNLLSLELGEYMVDDTDVNSHELAKNQSDSSIHSLSSTLQNCSLHTDAEIYDNGAPVDLDNRGFSGLSKSEDGIFYRNAQTSEFFIAPEFATHSSEKTPCSTQGTFNSEIDLTLESRNMPEYEAFQSVNDDYIDMSPRPFSMANVSMEACNQSECFLSKPAYKFASSEDEPCVTIEPYESCKLKNSSLSDSNHDQLVPFPTLRVLPGEILIPPVDEIQLKTLKALKVLEVIDSGAVASDLCTRREYARWLVSASGIFSSNAASKVYPAMYVENVSELAFDDVMPNDPDFGCIQGLAEAGIISSRLWEGKVHQTNMDKKFYFSPESPLCRQDLVSWKIALDTKLLPESDENILYELSGFLDINKISCDAWPALMADLSSSDPGIITLAFGYTKLFHPEKPVTKGQAAIALSTRGASDLVSEVAEHNDIESSASGVNKRHPALLRWVEEGIHDMFEQEIAMEKEKIIAMQNQVAEVRLEFDKLKEKEGESIYSDKERNMLELEMVALYRLRHEVEVEMEGLEKNKVILSSTQERITILQNKLECEHKEISQLHYDLGVEKRALYMARLWAEEEGRKAREEAKALEKARGRWENHGIKVLVGRDLREVESPGVTWVDAQSQTVSLSTVTTILKLKAEKMSEWSSLKMLEFKNLLCLVLTKILELRELFLRKWMLVKKIGVQQFNENKILKQGRKHLVSFTHIFNSREE